MAGSSGRSSINADARPEPRVVQEFHTNSDVDSDKDAQHHTLGAGSNQASPGDHIHDGRDSPQLGIGIEITGSTGGNTALQSVIAAMEQILGVTDSTTP